MTKVLIIGAFDRYNYGDLLFPLVIEQQLNTYKKDFKFEFFGLIKSDLRKAGGPPTEGLQKFYEKCSDPNNPVHVIIAGGEALGVTWNSLFAALNPFFQHINKRHVKLNQLIDLNLLTKKILKGKTTLPFAFDKSNFPGVLSVTLNSLGGSGLDQKFFDKYDFLKSKLEHVDYFAVRDRVTLANLKACQVDADLCPDSAILMSEFYPVEYLQRRITAEVKSYVDANKGKYVFVQINKKTTKGHVKTIASGLDEIYTKDNVPLCLCPIGKALDHDDQIALQQLGKILKSPHTYFDAFNIWDIMYLIANSKCYIGTSLHGAITAMSYCVPHVGLKVEKLGAYLATWGTAENHRSIEFSEIYSQFQVATSVSNKDLKHSRDVQLSEIRKGFDKMAKVLTK